MKRITSTSFDAPGTAGRYLERPAGATHFVVATWPIAAVQSPPPAGLTRAHVCVGLMRERAASLTTATPKSAYDLADEPHGTPLDLMGAVGIVVYDGGAAGTTAMTSGEVAWYGPEPAGKERP